MAKKKSKNKEDNKDTIKSTDDETPIKEEITPKKEKKSKIIDPAILDDNKKDQVDFEEKTNIETDTKKSIKKPVASKTEIKLFNRWSFENLEVKDPSLIKYINLQPIIIPHSGGKHDPDLRTVLYHQGTGPGHGVGAGRQLRDRENASGRFAGDFEQ